MPDRNPETQDAEPWDLAVVGGGAAGFFAAITAAEASKGTARIIIFEKSSQPLGKVKVSGGGRCNVTHACFDPREFTTHFPRGEKALIGPLSRWGSAETIDWFESRGVPLHTESDGRMFPTTNQSQTIIDCLIESASRSGVAIRTNSPVGSISPCLSGEARFQVDYLSQKVPASILAHHVLLAPGGSRAPSASVLAAAFHPDLIPPVPSLFTFQVDSDPRFADLQGISVAGAALSVPSLKLSAHGPLLITHWGLSGPAVLRLSAWGARELSSVDYHFDLIIDWLPGTDVRPELLSLRTSVPKRTISARSPFEQIPKRLWERLTTAAQIPPGTIWSQLSNAHADRLTTELSACQIRVDGKSLNKEEFVTCGGVRLDQVDLRTMGSRTTPGLYFAGEILDIDGITGGFNFQHAWTSGHIAGSAIAKSFNPDPSAQS